jgi:Tol biopolymer transport system component
VRRCMTVVLLAAALIVILVSPAGATFAGRNGPVTEAWYDNDRGAHQEIAFAIVSVPWLRGAVNPHTLRTCTSLDGCPEFDHPAYSADGARLVFAQEPNIFAPVQTSELVLASADGASPIVISDPAANYIEPSFAPSGGRLVFVRTALSGAGVPETGAVVTSNVAGTDIRVVSSLSSSDPVMSPNGRSVLFVHAGSIWSAGTDGSHPHRLISNASTPDFSPSGRKIVYASGRQQVLYLAQADGTHRVPVLQRSPRRHPARLRQVDYPVFSPDGKQLAFATTDQGGNPVLMRVPIGSGRVRALWTTGSLDSGGTNLGTAWRPLR